MREDLAVEVRRDWLLIRRGKAEVGVFSDGMRHMVNALVEAAVKLVDQQARRDYVYVNLR